MNEIALPLHASRSFSRALVASLDDQVATPGARRVLRAGALYDLLVTLPFATPFTAKLVLDAMRGAHVALGLSGGALPEFTPTHLLFVSFFGTVVTLWSYLRLRTHARVVFALDTVGRASFSTWMLVTLLRGGSPVVLPFLVLELTFCVAQALAVKKP